MKLKEIELHHFRNYDDVNMQFSPGINVLLGNNAQGKTNMLEAIYVLALTRSHRTSNNRDLIEWQSEAAQIYGNVAKRLGDTKLEIDLGKKGKRAKVNHLEQAKLSSYVGELNVILFAPEDLSIVKGSPSIRRRFMDMEFGQMSNQYLYDNAQYRKILKQRNNYLKKLQMKEASDQLYLEVLSDQLAAYGSKIIFQRIDLLKKLEGWAADIHAEISQDKEKLQFKYACALKKKQLSDVDSIYNGLLSLYTDNRDKEIRQGNSLYGPHRDDLQFIINKKDVSTFGSQGQQRTSALSVKLAEIDLMKEETHEYPILLLDDVLSELDDSRQTHLLKSIQDKVQTFLTTTSLSGIARELISDPKIFNIESGTVSEEK
ncbi:DNA replication/repair protein RecF [Apilactobacillus micheneri]|uniref:DNA replication and repair protein RecF n=1 Tax=Apilactobacillus micheneri TaxID=1899430 RepID=A0A9Q8IME2_9LACO|nr:DNA replication/repair protein RecF [Apilactobacillus micheneri]TPR39076.1 DNA replication/repair protein RecF [Apilactobacillus micheneri]TPR40036.1 DNA replication/repair protein RecF [Apilactobacillus micheneri]TPR41847.1 DNA replication/repair protein RecF [Apilactobacillus micheneri]TPR44238.1 DNA replication/repair protein RecF [Apilactobacillus micheneri]TPR45862.1 DNA replication/repair protein RecF [Apilactobacillus micheneri]